jgi:hypothetical protein
MLHNQTTPPAVIINTDVYTKYDIIIKPTIINETKEPSNNSNKSVVYPTMFDRWRDF